MLNSTNMRNQVFLFLICLLIISSLSLSHASNTSSCPINFDYVNTFPWDTSDCLTGSAENCCSSLRSFFWIGLAYHLKETKTFYLPTLQASASCISDFQSHLSLIKDFRKNFSTCLTSANEFVSNPNHCDGIMTVSDWVDKVGPTPMLDSLCAGDLTGSLKCRSCFDEGMAVNSRLVSLTPNSTKCYEINALYAAAIINRVGLENPQTADCILGLTLSKQPVSKSNSSRKKNMVFAISGALIGVVVVLGVILVYMSWNHIRKKTKLNRGYVKKVKDRVPNTGAKWFSIEELDLATNGFSQQNVIGQGGFGVVYKGTLEDGTVVAVKKMTSFDVEADNDFVNEAEIISKIRHRNLLPLRGFCVTSDPDNGNERYLVYDFMPNGNLHEHIFEENKKLSWPQRKSIILDVANGLSYLHNGIKPAIFHRDIKAANILLDSNMKALLADFGLAKESRDGQSHMTTRIAGTYGYVAPEYALYGQLTEKSDVYSFGIIVLEIMSGRKVLEASKGVNSRMVMIADWVWEMVKSDRIEEVFDCSMEDATLPKGVMSRFIRVGLLCAHSMVALRPTISEALKMLEGDIDIPLLLDRPPPLGYVSSRLSFQLSDDLWSGSKGSMFSSSLEARN